MRTIAIGIVVAVALGWGQDRPDLSGAWVASKDAPGDVPAAPSPVLGARLWLQQSGERLTVVRPVRDKMVSASFPVDGSEVRTRIPGGVCQGDAETIETVAWDGSGLAFTVVGTIPPGGGPPTKLSAKRVLRLRDAETLLIEASMRDSAQGEPRRVATIYKRTADPPPTIDTAPAKPTRAAIGDVAWIAGVWTGTAGAATVEERWTPAGGGSMLATARTLRGTAMTGFEFLCIAERNGGLVYTALPNARTPATDFTLTTITADSATFENPTHDYPKLIRYSRRADGTLETTIGGDAKQRTETVVLKKDAPGTSR